MAALARVGCGLAAVAALAAEPPAPPIESGLSTTVEVKVVTINVIALDSKNRTVADLAKEDFTLFVDGKETPLDTLDVFCDGGGEVDPSSLRIGKWQAPADLRGGTRRVVLAFDYLHVGNPIAALQQYQDVLSNKTGIGDEEMMVVALTKGLRIEQPFTRDRAGVVRSLRRMEHDITLWNGRHEYLTEFPLFADLDALVTVLRTVPGQKAVVFVSAGFGSSDSTYDNEFRRLSSRAHDAQVTFYPVDMGGVDVVDHWVPAGSFAGGPRALARLASATGGRLTLGSNDFTLGYARARRDLGCRYMLGFYDRKPEENTEHSLEVKSNRDGVRLRYAQRYWFPSNAERRAQSIQAAYLAPQMFEGGGMRAHVFPVEPKDRDLWEALIALDFPVPIGAEGDATAREFGVVLRRGSDVAHSFHRKVTLTPTSAEDAGIRRLTFLEPATIPPGRYTVNAVLSDPARDKPFAAEVEVDVPKIPKKGPFLVGPILGRRRGGDVVIFGGTSDRVGEVSDFRPLLVSEIRTDMALASLTQVCVVKPSKSEGPWIAERTLLTEAGEPVAELPGIQLPRLGKKEPIVCRKVFDELPVSTLPLGRYNIQATLAGADAALLEAKRIPVVVIADGQGP